jgi:hypothetical protein
MVRDPVIEWWQMREYHKHFVPMPVAAYGGPNYRDTYDFWSAQGGSCG